MGLLAGVRSIARDMVQLNCQSLYPVEQHTDCSSRQHRLPTPEGSHLPPTVQASIRMQGSLQSRAAMQCICQQAGSQVACSMQAGSCRGLSHCWLHRMGHEWMNEIYMCPAASISIGVLRSSLSGTCTQFPVAMRKQTRGPLSDSSHCIWRHALQLCTRNGAAARPHDCWPRRTSKRMLHNATTAWLSMYRSLQGAHLLCTETPDM